MLRCDILHILSKVDPVFPRQVLGSRFCCVIFRRYIWIRKVDPVFPRQVLGSRVGARAISLLYSTLRWIITGIIRCGLWQKVDNFWTFSVGTLRGDRLPKRPSNIHTFAKILRFTAITIITMTSAKLALPTLPPTAG